MEIIENIYENLSISEAVLEVAKNNRNKTAITYMGRKISFDTLMKKINRLACSFYDLGIKKGDVVLVALPNIPQAVYSLYALNRVGAVPAFVSPLSAEYELEEYINKCGCEVIIALDSLYEKLIKVLGRVKEKKLLIASAWDEIIALPKTKIENAVYLSSLIKANRKNSIFLNSQKPCDTALILFSGGTTGKPKAVEITNSNLNALAWGTEAACENNIWGVKMLAVLPMFHGFGLGICIHTVLLFGGNCILVPRFDNVKTGRIINKTKPHYIAVVPAMLNPLMSSEPLAKADFSNLRGVFSGGDILDSEVEDAFNKFLLKHKSNIKIRQGYGLTECVAASCLMPANKIKKGSIGKPYFHTLYKIVKSGTLKEAKAGETGEICISGKTVMKGYFRDKTETEMVLKKHSDGKLWLHTGDMGYADEEGFVYFMGRIKRIIVSNGYNIYPGEVEKALLKYKGVKECCVLGVKDREKSECPIVFAVMKNKDFDANEKQKELLAHLKKFISKQSMPKLICFLEKLPRTSVGKIDLAKLTTEAENL